MGTNLRALLVVLLVTSVAVGGCVKKQQEGTAVNASDSVTVEGKIDYLRIVEREVDGYGTCTFAVVEYDGGDEGGAGITLIGCQKQKR